MKQYAKTFLLWLPVALALTGGVMFLAASWAFFFWNIDAVIWMRERKIGLIAIPVVAAVGIANDLAIREVARDTNNEEEP